MKIEFQLPKVPSGLIKFQRIVVEESTTVVDKSNIYVRKQFIKASPVAFGTLATSWVIDSAKRVGRSIVGRVVTTQWSALVIDKGARPHTPPTAPIKRWVTKKLGLSEPKDVYRAVSAVKKKARAGRLGGTKIFVYEFIKARKIMKNLMYTAMQKIESRMSRD